MRLVASLLNIALILLLVYALIDQGMPVKGGEIAVLMLAFSAPAASLFSLTIGHKNGGNSWFSLFVERKQLEERQRIEAIKSGLNR